MAIPWLGGYTGSMIAVKRSYELTLGKMEQPRPTEGDAEVGYLNSGCVSWDGIQSNPEKTMWASHAEIRNLAILRGDLLISEGGDVGRAAIYDGDPGLIFQKSLHRARGYHGSDVRYLKYLMVALHGSGWLDILCNKATMAHFTAEKLGALEIPCLQVEEQRRIADFLDAETARIDQIVEARRRSRNLIHEKTFATICNLATVGSGSTERTDDPWIPIIGAGWQVLPLKRRWRIVDCKHRTPQYIENGYPVISPGDITAGRLDPSVAHRFVDDLDYRDLADNPRRARRGDIVYGRNASVGVAAFVDTDEKFTMGQDVCRITSSDQDQLFLAYFLNSAALAQLGSIQIGSTFTRVNISTLLELRVPCPPLEEQKRLAAVLDLISREAEQAMSAIDKQLSLLTERRQALITAAVTGRITV